MPSNINAMVSFPTRLFVAFAATALTESSLLCRQVRPAQLDSHCLYAHLDGLHSLLRPARRRLWSPHLIASGPILHSDWECALCRCAIMEHAAARPRITGAVFGWT